jgi:anhydro-N-acetylmuramic acid kinase
MNNHLALGLMSGTSADGVSAALGEFHGHSYKLHGHLTIPYPAFVVEKIRRRGALPAAEVSRLDVELGELFAQAANKLLKKTRTRASAVTCIGSHGQTLYHGPADTPKNTLQLADPATIAERTGISVVSHFRQRDIAAGGEGAPLIPYFDQFFFGAGPVRALLNLGGIANVTIVGKNIGTPLAFDTGPANCLMDMAVQLLANGQEDHDHNGQRAKRGAIDPMLAAAMIQDPYFKKPPPKSTGPELFNREFLDAHCGELLRSNPDGALATLMYFTCLTIQEAFRDHVFGKYAVSELVVSGGGAHNKTLMKKLECLFAPIPVISIEALGLPAQAKEPLAFAFFGLRCFHGQINHLPSGTGAKAARVLGRLTRA